MLKLVHDATADAVRESEPRTFELDELCRLAAKEMLAAALAAERRAHLDVHADRFDAAGRRLVVGNGYARPREVVTEAGAVEVDGRREGCRFSSAILPACTRSSPRSPRCSPLSYCGDSRPATSPRRSVSSSAPRRACRLRR